MKSETLAWLHQAARIDGGTYAQVLLIILERLELLEKAQEDADHFVEAPKVASTPKAAPVATDEELLAMRSWSSHGPTFDSDLVEFGRFCYNLGRQHGAAQPPAPQPAPPAAPAGGLVERVTKAIIEAMVMGDHAAAIAAIREVAAWMRENETGYNAAHWLEQEANR